MKKPDDNGPNHSDRINDTEDLQKLGYAQQLRRSMGSFSSFAISFSLISITTGIFANFSMGIREAGPAVIWSWTVVVFGQLLVSLVIAELSTPLPAFRLRLSMDFAPRQSAFRLFRGVALVASVSDRVSGCVQRACRIHARVPRVRIHWSDFRSLAHSRDHLDNRDHPYRGDQDRFVCQRRGSDSGDCGVGFDHGRTPFLLWLPFGRWVRHPDRKYKLQNRAASDDSRFRALSINGSLVPDRVRSRCRFG